MTPNHQSEVGGDMLLLSNTGLKIFFGLGQLGHLGQAEKHETKYACPVYLLPFYKIKIKILRLLRNYYPCLTGTHPDHNL